MELDLDLSPVPNRLRSGIFHDVFSCRIHKQLFFALTFSFHLVDEFYRIIIGPIIQLGNLTYIIVIASSWAKHSFSLFGRFPHGITVNFHNSYFCHNL